MERGIILVCIIRRGYEERPMVEIFKTFEYKSKHLAVDFAVKMGNLIRLESVRETDFDDDLDTRINLTEDLTLNFVYDPEL